MEELRIKALSQFLDCNKEGLIVSDYDDCLFKYGSSREYLVLNDEEADDRWEEELDNYIDN